MANPYDDNEDVESGITQDLGGSTPGISQVDKIQGITGVGSVTPTGSSPNITKRTLTSSYQSKQQEDTAQNEAQLQYSTGVERVRDSEEAKEWLSAKQLYEKTLGVTEYEELRNKLNLRDDESFTDYYNRTHYVPEGFEVQAQLLLAEEKRKKLYTEVQQGNMSEEDFLYEAYGKDLLKEEGIDFSSSLYWYNRYKNGDYSDPRKNDTYMLQLIENARTLFQAEKWYEESQQADLADTLKGLVTGEELPASTIQEIFSDQFEALSEYFDNAEQIVKYYRAGMLQGFDPTIDIDGDGKIDYYLAPDGKLYNVNESGEGANTYKAYYNSDGSLNRIVAADSWVGEMSGEFLKSIGRFFTGVIDFGALLVGTVVDIFDGGKFGDTIADFQAATASYWNTTILKDSDYIVDSGFTNSDGSFNLVGVGRQLSSLAGTVAAFVLTSGMSTAISAASKVGTVAATELPKGLAGTTAKFLGKIGGSKIFSSGLGKGVKAVSKFALSTALQLTSWSNGAFGSGIAARAGTALMLAAKDGLQATATLAVNQKRLGISDSEVVTRGLAVTGVNFLASFTLRSVADQGAMTSWAKMGKALGGFKDATAKGAIANAAAPNLFQNILQGTMTSGQKIGVGIANTVMDQIENTITAATTASINSKGKVLDWETLGNLYLNPSFLLNSIYQMRNTFKDEVTINQNTIIGATTDTVAMDQEWRAYCAKAKQNITDPEQRGYIDQVLVDYDSKIKSRMEETNPTTGAKYTRAEATLAALDEVYTKLDLGQAADFMPKAKKKVEKYLGDVKRMYAQAVFNDANNTYKAYQDIQSGIWHGVRTIWSKSAKNLLSEYDKYMQKYFAIPIDTQLMNDLRNPDFMPFITKKIRETKDEIGITDENFTITSGVKRIDIDENGYHDTKYTTDGVSEEAMDVYKQKIVGVWGMEGRTEDTFIILKNEGDSQGQKQNIADNEMLRATAEVELKISEINPDVNPFIVELGDGVYVIPYLGGIGDQFQKIENISAVFNTLRIIRYNYKNNKSVKEHFFDIVSIAYGKNIAEMPVDDQKKYYKEMRIVLNSLCGENKPLNDGDAVRIIKALKTEGVDILSSIETDEDSYSHLQTLASLTKMEDDYQKAKDSYVIISKSFEDKKSKLSESQLKEHLDNINSFKQKYLSQEGNSFITIGQKYGLLNNVLLKNISAHPFPKGLQEGLDLTSLLGSLRNMVNQTKDPQTKKALLTTFLDRFGHTSEPISAEDVETSTFDAIENSLVDLYLIRDEETGNTLIGRGIKDESIKESLRKEYGDKFRETATQVIDELFNTDITLEEAIDKFQASIDSQDFSEIQEAMYDSPEKTTKLLTKDEITSIFVEKILGEYTENIPDKELARWKEKLSKGSFSKQVKALTSYAQKKYKYTLTDYKNIETMFTNDLQLAAKIHKHSTNVEAKKILVIDLNRVIGDTGESVLRKFGNNDSLLLDFLEGDDTSKLNQLGGKTKLAEFAREMSAIKGLKREYQDDVLYFHIESADEEKAAKNIISKFYNYAYTERAADDTDMPGVYLVSKDTEGIELKMTLADMESIANNYNDFKATSQSTELTYNFFDVFESLSSQWSFINEDSIIDPDVFAITFMLADSDTRTFKNVISYINNSIDVKLGKLAGNKVKNIATGYTGFGYADNSIDMGIAKQYFLRRIVDEISVYWGNTSAPSMLINKSDVPKLKGYKDLFTIITDPTRPGKAIISPISMEADAFKKIAYSMLEKDTTNIKYLLNINSQGVTKENSMIGSSIDGTVPTLQLTTGETPISIAYEKLLREFNASTDFNSLITDLATTKIDGFKQSDVSDSVTVVADGKTINILELFKGKTIKDILDADAAQPEEVKSNIFYQMEMNAIRGALEVTEAYRNKLTQNDNVFKMLGDRNFRANLATAMNDASVRKEIEFKDGQLVITDKLVNAILKVYNPVRNKANELDARRAQEIDTLAPPTILTGAQTGTFNTKYSTDIDMNSADLKEFLTLAQITSVRFANTEQTSNPLQTLYAMMYAATGEASGNKSYVTLKELHHLSNQDCDIILKELKGKIDDASYNKLRDTIYLIKTGDSYTEDSEPLSSDTYMSTKVSEEPGIKKTVSRNSSDGMITPVDEDMETTAATFIFTQLLTNAANANYGKERLKISGIIDNASTKFARDFYALLSKTKMPNITNKGSLLVANMDIATNRAALFNTLARLTQVFSSDTFAETAGIQGKKNKLTADEAANLALDLYMYTTGDDYQPYYSQYLIYDKKKRKLVSTALSSKSYSKDYDDLITELFMHTNMFVDNSTASINTTDPSKSNINDIVIISAPRNSLSSIYSADMNPDIQVMRLDEPDEVGRAKVKALVDYSYTNFVNRYKASHKSEVTTEERLRDEYINSLFNKRSRTAKFEAEKNKEYISKFAIDGVDDSIFNSMSSYLFTSDTISMGEARRNDYLGINYDKPQAIRQKEKDAITYGITDDVLSKNPGFVSILKRQQRDATKELKVKLGTEDISAFDDLVEAFNTRDESRFKLAITNLKTKITEDSAPVIIKYLLANSPSLESKMYILSGEKLDSDYYKDIQVREAYKLPLGSGEQISLGDLRNTPIISGDVESVYDSNNTLVYQAAFEYYDGKTTQSKVLYLPLNIPGIEEAITTGHITSGRQLAEFLNNAGYTAWYKEYYLKNKGTQLSIDNLYAAYKGIDGAQLYRGEINPLASFNIKNKEEPIFIGFNNANYDNKLLLDNIQDDVLQYLIANRSIDLRPLKDEVPSILQFRNMKSEGTLSGSLDTARVTTDNEHDALADASAARKLLNVVIDNTITTNHYQNTIVDSIEVLKDWLGLKDIELNSEDLLFNISLDKLTDKELIIYNQLKEFNNSANGVTRLKAIVDYMNYRNTISAINLSDIGTKDVRHQLFESLSDGNIKFANTFNKIKNKQDVIELISIAVDKVQRKKNKTSEAAKNEVVWAITGGKHPSNNNITSALSDIKNLRTILNITDEDITNYRSDGSATKYNIMSDPEIKSDRWELITEREDLNRRALNFQIVSAEKVITDNIDSLLKGLVPTDKNGKPSSDIVDTIQDFLFNFFDVDADSIVEQNGNRILPQANTGRLINALSKIDNDAWEYLLKDPFLSQGYQEIYRLVTASPLNHKLKTVDGKQSILPNDTLGITQKQLAKLMGVQDLTEKSLKESMGLSDKDTLYIPVVRHPLDKVDSFHFLKVMIIDEDQGVDILVNADTMKTRFNGDLDGDHIMILKPTTEMEAFANTKGADGVSLADLQHQPLTILYDALQTTQFNSSPGHTYIETHYDLVNNAKKNATVIGLLKQYKSKVDADPANYDSLKEQFSSEFKQKLSIDDTELKDLVDEIFWHKPVDMSPFNSQVENKRFVTFTDYLGIYSSELKEENFQDRRRYRYGEMSTYDILRLGDSESGTLQKSLYNKLNVTYDDLQFVENIIRLSGTTKGAIDNLSEAEQTKVFDSIFAKIKGHNKTLNKFQKDIKDLPFSERVEKVLMVIQLQSMSQRQSLAGEAIKTLQQTESPNAKFVNYFLNSSDYETPDGNVIKDMKFITDIKRSLKNSYTGSSTMSSEEAVDALLNLLTGRIPIRANLSKEEQHKILYTPVKVLEIEPHHPRIKIDGVVTEDTVLPLPGIDNYEVRKPKVFKLNVDSIKDFEHKSTGDYLTPKELSKLGISKDLEGCVRLALIDAENNNIVVSMSTPLNNQKVVFAGSDATKATVSTYATVTGVTEEVLKQCAFVRYAKQDKAAKAVTTPKSGNVSGWKIVTDEVNIAEAPRFWSQDVSTSSFEELAHANNVDSIGGLFLYNGECYKVSDDGEVKVSFDNDAITKAYDLISSANMPDRTESNGYTFYLLLKMITLAKQNNLSQDEFRSLYGGGPAAWYNYTAGKYSTSNGKDFNSVILSKELEEFMTKDTLRRTNATISDETKLKSNASAPTQLMQEGKAVSNRSASGPLTDYNNQKFGFSANHYISQREFINKLNALMGSSSRLWKSSLQEADTLGMLHNGEYQRRTQTSNGPREYYDSEVDVRSNYNTSTKTGQIYSAENLVSSSRSISPVDLTSDMYAPDEEYTGFNSKHFHRAKSPYKSDYSRDKSAPNTPTFNNILGLLKSDSFSSDLDYASFFSKKSDAIASIRSEYLGFDNDGNIKYSTKATKINGTTNPTQVSVDKLLKIYQNLGISSTYYSDREVFKQNVQLTDPESVRFPGRATPNNNYDSNEYNTTQVLDSIQSASDYRMDTSEQVAQMKREYFASTVEEVADKADRRFYSGTKDGETKVFTAEKIKMNQGIKLDSTEALEADRVIKGMSAEANAISMGYDKQLVILNNIAARNGSTEELNKFAYVLAAANKLKVIDEELKTAKGNKQAALEEAKVNTQKVLTDMGITDAATYVKEFSSIHTEEANMVTTLLKGLNEEAQKYSKLCGEPGDNIFFLLTPSATNNKKENKAKASYIISMLAKGNNPVKYDKNKMGYIDSGIPTYDGYNFFSSLATSITSISKQAAIYTNSQRMKKLGFMTNASITSELFEILSQEDLVNNVDAYKINKDSETAYQLYIGGLKEVFADDPEVTGLLTSLQLRSRSLTLPERYKEALVILKGYIDKQGISLEDASSTAIINKLPENMNEATYKKIITAYDLYADTFAQLAWFTNDTLIDKVYSKLITSVPENKVFVDKFGRKLDDIYGLSENSLEVYLNFIDDNLSNTGNKDKDQKRKLVTKMLKGELYTMDKTLADTLSERVFVKKDLGKVQSALRKISSFCVSALMSNPFKIIDRFVKFSMFDMASLSTADAGTLTKAPEAFKDLRAYFASKGVASTKDLDEFMYSQGINISHDNFDTIYNNNDSSFGFNPVKTYTDAVGNVFDYQTLATRYAYWLSAKEKLKNGDYSVLGSAYYLKDQLAGLEATNRVSKEGQQASFAMAQILGAPNDFPAASKTLSSNGMVFTTFPLAAMRWGIGEVRSLGTVVSEMFKGNFNNQSAMWLFRNGSGILGTFIAEQLMISVIADMFGIESIFGRDDDEEENEDTRKKEWLETGALPNITQTLLTGSPIMDTYSSMNATRELKGMLIDPFIKEEDNSSGGITRFFYKNILSHVNPLIKNTIEVATNTDIIDDQVIDTKNKYTMMENVARKFSSYLIGSAGANAMINSFNNSDSMGENFINGLTAAVSAECGNTKAYKSNLKNYYKSLSNINSYLYSDLSSDYLKDSNTDNIKSEIRELISSQANVSDVYSLIQSLNNKGYSANEIRSAFRSCSLQYKLEQVSDLNDLMDSLTDASYNNIKTALAFESYMYPWLEEGINYLDRYIKSNSSTYMPSLYYPTNYYNKYNNYYNSNYSNSNSNYNSNSNNYKKSYVDPFSTYTTSQSNIAYQKKQAEYKRRQQQYGGNK